MNEPIEFDQRIARALARIGAGIERMHRAAPAGGQTGSAEIGGAERDAAQAAEAEALDAAQAEIVRLQDALANEREVNGQLSERLKKLRDKQEAAMPDLEARLAALTRQIDSQGVEVQRLKMTNVQLRETIQAMREAMEKGLAEPGLVNKSLAAELEALRAARSAEVAELDVLLDELKPIIAEISHA